MQNIQELIAQREALDIQIANIRKEARDEAVAKIRALIAENGLTQADIFVPPSIVNKVKTAGVKAAPKYRHPVSQMEWSGRGLTPRWILESGEPKENFLIQESQPA